MADIEQTHDGFDCDVCGAFIPTTPSADEPNVYEGDYFTPASTLDDETLPDIICRKCAEADYPQLINPQLGN